MPGTMSETGGHVKRDARAVHEVVNDDSHQVRKALPSVFCIAGRRDPAVFAVKPKCIPITGGTTNITCPESAAVLITDLLERSHDTRGEFGRFGDQHVQCLHIKFVVPGEFTKVPVVKLFLQNKIDILLTYLEMCHQSAPPIRILAVCFSIDSPIAISYSPSIVPLTSTPDSKYLLYRKATIVPKVRT